MKTLATRWIWGLAALGLGALGPAALLPALSVAGTGRMRLVWRLQRVQPGESCEARDALAEPGVVLHGARTERVEPLVDGVVQLAEAMEVLHDLELADVRNHVGWLAKQLRG